MMIIRKILLMFFFAATLAASAPSHAAHNSDGAYDDADHKNTIIGYIEDYWIPSLMMMTEQLSAIMMQQAQIVGTFLDAKMQLEIQTLLQDLEAQAHKDYRPEIEICMIGTNVRSLAASESKYKANARLLSKIMMDRETLSENGAGATGYPGDKTWRFEQFTSTFCDKRDDNGQLKDICSTPTLSPRSNNDINFTRTVDKRLTLDIDFTDVALTDDEEDIIALSKNLFANDIFWPIPPKTLLQEYAKDDLQDIRSVIAMRGVARNSWGHLIGMKASGTEESGPFIKSIIRQLGVPAGEIDTFIGENPSYFAQMEVLTKKIFQNPDFYTNLYTSPANLERTAVALQALQLMQDRDSYESALRREMLISILLETKLRYLQEGVNNDLLSMVTLYVNDTLN